jgi:prepilin-type N-terminal cleavage/methylation domain-containing protein
VEEAIVMELKTRCKNSSGFNFQKIMTNPPDKSVQKGFTIIEVVAVCAIIVIITFLGLLNFNPT